MKRYHLFTWVASEAGGDNYNASTETIDEAKKIFEKSEEDNCATIFEVQPDGSLEIVCMFGVWRNRNYIEEWRDIPKFAR